MNIKKSVEHLGHQITDAAAADIEQIVKHPQFLAGLLAGPEGPAILAELNRHGAFKGITNLGHDLGGKLFGGGRPIHKKPASDPASGYKNVAGGLAGVAGSQCSSGQLPWLWSSEIPVGTGAQTKRTTSIGDFMASANCAWFSGNGTFPLTFQASCIYGIVSGKGAIATKENMAYLAGLYVEMSVATIIAQYALLDLGVRVVKEDVVTTSGGGYAGYVDRPEPVEWTQVFDPKATYVWTLRTNQTTTPTAAYDVTLNMPGVVINGGS